MTGVLKILDAISWCLWLIASTVGCWGVIGMLIFAVVFNIVDVAARGADPVIATGRVALAVIMYGGMAAGGVLGVKWIERQARERLRVFVHPAEGGFGVMEVVSECPWLLVSIGTCLVWISAAVIGLVSFMFAVEDGMGFIGYPLLSLCAVLAMAVGSVLWVWWLVGRVQLRGIG